MTFQRRFNILMGQISSSIYKESKWKGLRILCRDECGVEFWGIIFRSRKERKDEIGDL